MKEMSKKGTEHTLRVKEKYRKYFFLFIAFAVLFLVIPYCDDDLRWGSSVGMERLASWFEGYGGRYLGYIIIILLTKFYPLKVVLQALTLTFLVYMLDQLSYEKQTEYASVIFLFFMPLLMFSDTIGWTSGFANYVTSVTFSLVYVKYVYRRLDGENVSATYITAIGFIALGMVNCLIVEHFTVYNFCLAVFMILYTLATEKRIRLPELGYLAGTVGGIAIMFSNSAYRKVASGDDFYRGVNTSVTASTIVNRFGKIINICYLQLPLIVISITVVIYLLWKERRRIVAQAVQRLFAEHKWYAKARFVYGVALQLVYLLGRHLDSRSVFLAGRKILAMYGRYRFYCDTGSPVSSCITYDLQMLLRQLHFLDRAPVSAARVNTKDAG